LKRRTKLPPGWGTSTKFGRFKKKTKRKDSKKRRFASGALSTLTRMTVPG